MKSDEDGRPRKLRNALARFSPGGFLWLMKWLLLVAFLVLMLLAVILRDDASSIDVSAAGVVAQANDPSSSSCSALGKNNRCATATPLWRVPA